MWWRQPFSHIILAILHSVVVFSVIISFVSYGSSAAARSAEASPVSQAQAEENVPASSVDIVFISSPPVEMLRFYTKFQIKEIFKMVTFFCHFFNLSKDIRRCSLSK